MIESMQGDRAALEAELKLNRDQRPDKTGAAGEPAAGAGGGKARRGAGAASASEYHRARRIVDEWGTPLAFAAGEVWSFDPALGWIERTDAVLDRCNKVMGRNSEKGCFRVLCNMIAVPAGDGALYHRLIDRRWAPFTLRPTEVLFSDYRYDVVTEEAERLAEPVFGPRIMAPLEYDGEIEPRCSEFEDMIATAIPDPEIRRHFQEVIALTLQPHVHLRGQIVLWGRPGSRKSSIATAIACAAAGTQGASWVQEARLVRCKWASCALHGRFVNVSNDSPVHRDWPGWIKEYSSGTYTVEPKFGQVRTAAVTAKLISTCNEMQSLEDSSGAASDRLIPFRFDVAPARGVEVDRDHWLSPAFWSDRDRRYGILTWLLEGLTRLRQRGTFDEPAAWLEQRQRAVSEGDPIQAALLENVRAGADPELCFVATADLLALVPLLSGKDESRRAQRLAEYVTRLFPGARRCRRKIGGRDIRGWEGVELTTF